MSDASWQGRTALALVAGAVGEGACVVLAAYVAGGFIVLTFVVAIALGLYFGPWIGLVGAGLPPLGIAFVDTGGDGASFVSRLLTAVAVVLMLGFCAWFAGRLRERYGNPPWGHSTGVSE